MPAITYPSCPSTLLALLAAVSLHRVAYGLVLVFAFSIGLAATLTGIGLAFVYGGRHFSRLAERRVGAIGAMMQRLPAGRLPAGRLPAGRLPAGRLPAGRLVRVLPVASALVISLVGAVICGGAVQSLGLPGRASPPPPSFSLEGVFGLRMRVVRLKLGDESLELTQFFTPRGRLVPRDSRSNDHWFQHISIIGSSMDLAYARLRANHVGYVSAAPQRLPDWNKEAGGIEAFYFCGPDNHTLEILHFPPDKGDPKWHRAKPPLFERIDHSAIVVADTDASLKFYRDTLGMKVMGGSENYGMEQEHLNNFFGTRLRIASLRAASGPGIELLEYQTPQNGRPIPLDAHADDLSHWQTILRVQDAAAIHAAAEQIPLVLPGLVALPDGKLGFGFAVTGRDLDGHILELMQP